MIILLILLLQILIGVGIVSRFDVVQRTVQRVSLSVLIGFFLSTVGIYLLEIFHIPITIRTTIAVLSVLGMVTNYHFIFQIKDFVQWLATAVFEFDMYELLLISAIGYLLFFSAWRTYDLPVTPYDSVIGIDLVAKMAVAEKHIVSSLFQRPDFRPFLSTQPYYAPFTAFMQIIYRLAGFPFGQFWLGLLTIAFSAFAYSRISEKAHPLVAGFLVLLVLTAPELYAYTFLLQTDFSNAVFFAIGIIFTIDYINNKNKQCLWLAVIMLSAACWSRTETICIVAMYTLFLPIFLRKMPPKDMIQSIIAFMTIPSIFFILWNIIFFKFYFPVAPDSQEQVNWLGSYSNENATKFFNGMMNYLLSTDYWGYILYIFLLLLIVDALIFKSVRNLWLGSWLLLLFIAFFMMLHHFRLMNIEYTFRRGVMKFLLLACLLTAELPLVQMLSGKRSYRGSR